MTLPEQMLKYRARENISQKELARRCNVSLQTINCVETGAQTPSRLTRAKIEEVIGEEQND